MGIRSVVWVIASSMVLSVAAMAAESKTVPIDTPPQIMHANVRFNHIGLREGLAQSSVEALLQDKTGYIWIGTQDGLQLYDGYRFKTFRHTQKNPKSIANNFVTDLYLSSTGDLWVGTYSGLDRYESGAGFVHYSHTHRNFDVRSHNYVWSILESPQKQLWVGTNDGLERLDPATGKWTLFPISSNTGGKSAESLSGRPATATVQIWSLAYDQGGTLWIGTSWGLKYLPPGETRVRSFTAGETAAILQNNHINALVVDAKDRLWIGMEGALVRMSADRKQVKYILPTTEARATSFLIRDLMLDQKGGLWIATDGSGAYRLAIDDGTLRQFISDTSDPYSLSNNAVETLLQDRSGIIWLGTYTGGLNTYNPATRLFGHYRHQSNEPRSLSDNTVWGFAHDAQQRLWVATTDGLNRMTDDKGFVRYFHDPDNRASVADSSIGTLFSDSQQRLWIGTRSGLDLWQPQTDSFKHYHFSLPGTGENAAEPSNEEVAVNDIVYIYQAPQDQLWAGTAKGLIRFNPATGETRWYPPRSDTTPGFPGALVLDVENRPDGLLWVATAGGLSLLDPRTGQVKNYDINSPGPLGLPDNYVNTLYRGSEGLLWIGTSNGLLIYDEQANTSKLYTTVEGLPNNSIYCMLPDSQQNVWISTNNGLARTRLQAGDLQILGTYGPADGLQSREFNTSSCTVGPDGHLFFGGINGFNSFDPADISTAGEAARVIITNFSILGVQHSHFGAHFDNNSHLTLLYQDRAFTLEFALLDFAAPENNRFEYRLNGFDSVWRKNGNRNYVTYTNLDSGDYVFEVRGISANGVPSENIARLAITVESAPWATWWAFAAYIILGLLIIAGLIYLKIRRLKNIHALQHEQQQRSWAETLHNLSQTLATSLDARTVASQLADHLARLVQFNIVALFVEQGAELVLVGSRGLTDQQEHKLSQLPSAGARLLAEFRHVRKPMRFDSSYLPVRPFIEETPHIRQYLAVPLISRSEELTLLLLGRSDTGFSDRDVEVATAFTHQALNALDNARLFAEVQNLGTTDSLTRVHNRRYFFEQAELEFSRSKRYQRDLSLLLLDADHFRDINEFYGQHVGDRVMKLMAGVCRQSLRHFDIIGRYSGESFVIMLPETPVNTAADVADRLRKNISELSIETHRGELRLTISIGVAVNTFADNGDAAVEDLSSLINKADMALYEAKRSGRNRVVVS